MYECSERNVEKKEAKNNLLDLLVMGKEVYMYSFYLSLPAIIFMINNYYHYIQACFN